MRSVGIYHDNDKWLTVHLEKDKKLLYIKEFNSTKELIDVKQLDTLLITGLEGKDVLFRSIDLPLKSARAIRSAFPLLVEKMIPFDPAKAIVVPLQADALLFGCYILQKSSLEAHLKFWNDYQIDPDQVSCEPAALARAFSHLFPDIPNWATFHLTQKRGLCIATQEGKTLFSYTWNWDSPVDCKKELQRIYSVLEKKRFQFPLPSLFSGDRSLAHLLDQDRYTLFKTDDVPAEFMIPFGLALEGTSHDRHKVQLRQGSFVPEKIMARQKKSVLKYLATSLISLILLCGAIFFLLMQKEQKIWNTVRKYQQNLPPNLEESIQIWAKQLSKKQNAFVFDPQIPNPSQALATIASLPILQNAEIISFHYHLTDYPKWGEKSSIYQAKGEISLIHPISINSETISSLLHELPFVDRSKKIGFREEQGMPTYTFYFTSKHEH